MKKVLTGLVTGVLGAVLALGTAGGAIALTVSDHETCPSGRYLVTSGNATGWVSVQSGSRWATATGSTSSTRVYKTVKSYAAGRVYWAVASGTGDSERPGYSNDCGIS